jgi:homocysteine S-methyltransferase
VIEKQHNCSIDRVNSNKIPAWISFACSNSKQLNSGENIEDIVRFIEESSMIDSEYLAIGVNCSKPKYVEDIVHAMRDYSKSRVIVVYPNLGEK